MFAFLIRFILFSILLSMLMPTVRRLFGFLLLRGLNSSSNQKPAKTPKEGEVLIKKRTEPEKSKFEGGEYVDYEEVK